MKKNLLIVEDDKMLGRLISDYFIRKGWNAVIAMNGEEALDKFQEDAFHLILLDIMLPKKNGFIVCRTIRESSNIPIFFITARVLEEDELQGYALGADDYITKPFSLPALYAKANALMNRLYGEHSNQMICKGNTKIDLETGKVTIDGEDCHLPKLEYEMLLYFMENSNRIITREQLIIRFWGYDFDGNERIVDNHIKKLRQATAGSNCVITTIHKTGYRLEVRDEKTK